MTSLTALPAVLALAAGLAACGSGPGSAGTFGHELEATAFLDLVTEQLPDGGRVAVGSPDGHRVTVQWRDPSGSTWTAPETVHTDERLFTHDVTVEVAGSTVAIDPDFWSEEVLDDDYSPEHTVQVICHRRRCLPSHEAGDGTLSNTRLNDDGSAASFRLRGDRVLIWELGSGFRDASWTGLPDGARVDIGPGDTFVTVTGAPVDGACRFDLLATEGFGTTFTRMARSVAYPLELDCFVSGFEVHGNQVTGYTETGASLRFVRAEGAWKALEPPGED